jgi:hypothetical protein
MLRGRGLSDLCRRAVAAQTLDERHAALDALVLYLHETMQIADGLTRAEENHEALVFAAKHVRELDDGAVA